MPGLIDLSYTTELAMPGLIDLSYVKVVVPAVHLPTILLLRTGVRSERWTTSVLLQGRSMVMYMSQSHKIQVVSCETDFCTSPCGYGRGTTEGYTV